MLKKRQQCAKMWIDEVVAVHFLYIYTAILYERMSSKCYCHAVVIPNWNHKSVKRSRVPFSCSKFYKSEIKLNVCLLCLLHLHTCRIMNHSLQFTHIAISWIYKSSDEMRMHYCWFGISFIFFMSANFSLVSVKTREQTSEFSFWIDTCFKNHF